MDEEARELERRWLADTGDQPTLERLVAARRRARLPVPGELLERVVAPSRLLPAVQALELAVETPAGVTRKLKSGGRAPAHKILWGTPRGLERPGSRYQLDLWNFEELTESERRLRRLERRGEATRVTALLARVLVEAVEVGITGLRLARTDIEDDDLREIARRLPELLALDVSACLWLSPEGAARAVVDLRRLQRLDLTFDRWLGPGLAPLAELSELFELRFELSETTTEDNARAHLAAQARVFGGDEFAALPRSLRRLVLRHAVTGDALPALARLEVLEELDVHGSGATGAQVASLTSLTRLRALAIGRSGLNDATLARLVRALPRLEKLDVVRCDALTDAGLRELAASGLRLRELDVSFCRGLTSEGLAALATMTTLERLSLNGGQALRASWRSGREALVRALPGCTLLPKVDHHKAAT